MLVVLVGLDGDARQRGVRTDVVRLTQETVAGGKAVAEQLQQVDLTASRGQRQEVQIVDVDIALAVCLGMRRIEDEHLVELLGALGAVLEHGAHRGIAVDVGVLALDIVLERGLERQVLVHLHQSGVHLTHAGALVAVQDVLLSRAGMTAFDQHLLYGVLHLLNGGSFGSSSLLQRFFDLLCQLLRHIVVLAAGCLRGTENCICDLVDLKGSRTAIPLDDLLNHKEKSLSHTKTALRRFFDYLLNYVVLDLLSHNILCLLISCLYILPPKRGCVKAVNSFWHFCKKSAIFIGAFSKLFLLTIKFYQKGATNFTKFPAYFLCGNFSCRN